MSIVYAIEVGIRNVTTSTNSTLYLSTGGFVTEPSDTPANTAFDPRIIDPGSIGINLVEDGTPNVDIKLEIGEISIINNDGAYDYLIDPYGDIYNLDGKSVIIRRGNTGGAYPSSFTTIFRGTCDGIEVTYDKVIIRAKDNSYVLDKPFLTDTFAGTNTLPAGIEGTANDIKGDIKPWSWGFAYNVTPPICNTSKLIYKINQGMTAPEAVTFVLDGGVTLTAGADYTSQADMEANAPAASNYRVWPAGGYFRLGSSPVYDITAASTKGTTATNTVAQTMKQILSVHSITPVAGDVTALDTLNSNYVTLYVDDDRTIRDTLNEVAVSIGAYYFYDRSGQLRFGQFADPSAFGGTPATLNEYQILNIEHIPSSTNKPYAKYVFEYAQNETVQKRNELATSVTEFFAAWIRQPSRKSIFTPSGVGTAYNSNKVLRVKTRLWQETAADAEITRVSNMYLTPRHCYEVTIPIEVFDYELMAVISLTHPRFGLTGLYTALIGYTLNLESDTAILKLWG